MTWFTDSIYERLMTEKPKCGRSEKEPLASFSSKCEGCPYRGKSPCIGYCIRKIKEKSEPEL